MRIVRAFQGIEEVSAERMARAELYAEEFAQAVRALLNAPLGSKENRDAIIRCRVILETYQDERPEVRAS